MRSKVVHSRLDRFALSRIEASNYPIAKFVLER